MRIKDVNFLLTIVLYTSILNMLDAEAKFLASSNARTARNVERAREAEEERQKNR